jgi:hypothetical protein
MTTPSNADQQDTPTLGYHPCQQHNAKKYDAWCNSLECAPKQDDTNLDPSAVVPKGSGVVKITAIQDNKKPTEDKSKVGEASSIIQDDEQLREAIAEKVSKWFGEPVLAVEDELLALFQKGQIQLVSELEGELNNHALANTVDKDNHAWLVRDVLGVLEHKKQELEGKPQNIKRTGTMDVITKDEVKKFRDYDER